MADLGDDWTPNLIAAKGAATMIGRDGNQVQIRIVCGTEEEAKAVLENFAASIRRQGFVHMRFGGTIDEGASSGKQN
jgi:hypothetical protein